jgi:two-component system cell cycle response regulator
MAGRILIVDDIATNRIILKVKLGAACYSVLQANDGASALELIRRETPDLVLVDLSMPVMDGLDVCRAIKSDPLIAHIPVIVVSAHGTHDHKLQALRAGAEDFMTKPIDELALMARVRSLLRAQDISKELSLRESTTRALGFAEQAGDAFEPQGQIAFIATDTDQSAMWQKMTGKAISAATQILTREEALALGEPETKVPDVFVIAADIDHAGDGLQMISQLRSNSATRHSAIVVVTTAGAKEMAAMALDLGASDLLIEPLDQQEMAHRLRTQLTRKRQADRLRRKVHDSLQLAVTDPLTGLFNRRYAVSHMTRLLEDNANSGQGFAMMLLDLDRFKMVNDTFGHVAGDTVLKEVAARLKSNLRSVDLVARIGGEEFLVVMPDTSAKDAERAAERLCKVVEETPMPLPKTSGANLNGRQITQTVSIGVVVDAKANVEGLNNPEALIEHYLILADQAMYKAKSAGRNGVMFSRSAA